MNVIYEVALKEGFGLNSSVERLKDPKENKVWMVRDSASELALLICLDDEVKASLMRKLNLSRETPLVCRESAINDTVAANLALQCRLKTI